MPTQTLTLEMSIFMLALNAWSQKTFDISASQVCLLKWIASPSKDDDVINMTDIARKMGHSTAAATGMIDRLEKLGYAERSHAIDDRRKVVVSITQRGLEILSLWDSLHPDTPTPKK